jgi:hypothetical protein
MVMVVSSCRYELRIRCRRGEKIGANAEIGAMRSRSRAG